MTKEQISEVRRILKAGILSTAQIHLVKETIEELERLVKEWEKPRPHNENDFTERATWG